METYIVVGLGNPGAQYARTRHNAGWESLEVLARRWNVQLNKKKFDGLLGEVMIDGKRVVLCQPQTFMNASGECVQQLLQWYKCPLENMVVIYDDIDLALGKLRVRKSGSAGTHNGMRDIIYLLGWDDFPRVRVGIGRPPEGWDMKDWVLSGYNTPELRQTMFDAYMGAADVVAELIGSGVEAARQLVGKLNG